MKPLVGLSIFPEQHFFQTCLPLFEQEKIEVLEWSFDHYSYAQRPQWFNLLLHEYSEAERLIAHGVHYSAFTAKMTAHHQQYLAQWKKEQQHLKYQQITEHIGFKSQLNSFSGFPLPFDYQNVDLRYFSRQIRCLQGASNSPLGFELLALAMSKAQVISQAKFLSELCLQFNVFIVLDLHNLYCQAHNFKMSLDELISYYPVEYIREIHLSGGSYSSSDFSKQNIRRDTHDGVIPEVLFEVLQKWLPRFTHCKYIIMEQLPESLITLDAQQQFRDDFLRLYAIRDQYAVETKEINFIQNKQVIDVVNDDQSAEFLKEQETLTQQFKRAKQPSEIKALNLKFFDCKNWLDEMIETAIKLSSKWDV